MLKSPRGIHVIMVFFLHAAITFIGCFWRQQKLACIVYLFSLCGQRGVTLIILDDFASKPKLRAITVSDY